MAATAQLSEPDFELGKDPEEEAAGPTYAPGFEDVTGTPADFVSVDIFQTYWILTKNPEYSAEFRGHNFSAGVCRVDGLPKDADAARQKRRIEFFVWFASSPEGYRLYSTEPRRPVVKTTTSEDEEW